MVLNTYFLFSHVDQHFYSEKFIHNFLIQDILNLLFNLLRNMLYIKYLHFKYAVLKLYENKEA